MITDPVAVIISTMVATIAAIEVLLRLPLAETLRQAGATFGKSTRLLRNRAVSDHWKERAFRLYAVANGITTMRIGAFVLVFVATFALVFGVALGALTFSMTGLSGLLAVRTMLIACLVGAVYMPVRRRLHHA